MTADARSSRSLRPFLWCLVILGVGGILAWYVRWQRRNPPPPAPPPDMVAVFRANNRGIGLMEQFEYERAVAAFEEVVQLAPDWLPGRINLGIALLNTATGPNLERARATLQQVLQEQPNNPYAHYCLGIIAEHQGQVTEAIPHFEAVTRIDPQDAAAWHHFGNAQPAASEQALACFERARKLDPYLSGAIYGLAMGLRQQDLQRSKALLQEHKALQEALWDSPSALKYTEMGHYASVIGQDPQRAPAHPMGPIPLFAPSDHFNLQLERGTRWATAADFGTGSEGELRRRVRGRFGAVMVVLDYNHDGRPDLLLLGAVVQSGEVRDLLLRNDGESRFADDTNQAGLGVLRRSLGCCVGDFDNDGLHDLFITGIGEQHLLRNTGKGTFEDVTVQARIDPFKGVSLGAAWVDLDQDGDLDLIVTQYAATAEAALALFQGDTGKGSGVAVYLNVGEAPPALPREKPKPLKPQFRRAAEIEKMPPQDIAATNVLVTDADGDHDVDLLVLADQSSPVLILNDRLLRFHRAELPKTLLRAGRWNGGLVLDADHDARSDLFLLPAGQRPVFLLPRQKEGQLYPEREFEAGATNAPPLLQAQAIDLDYDGWADIVGLSEQHRPVFLQNDGQRLVHQEAALGRDVDGPHDVLAVLAAPLEEGKYQDVLLWSEARGLQLLANQGNGNCALMLTLSGRRGIDERGNKVRSNADGIGTWVAAQADTLWTDAEYTTLSAGLGQSQLPLVLGLGPRTQADVVRLRWPDNTPQAEFNLAGCTVGRIEETNRKTGSCPLLFAWNGRRFGFVTDFLGAGAMGESQPGGGHRQPRPEESVTIAADQLAARDGHYVLKVANPMDEVHYLDHLRLDVLDHPPDMRIYPDERFAGAGPPASQDLLAFRQEVFPVAARTHRGRDVTQVLRAWDRDSVDDFAERSWLGFAEEHRIELDFGDRLAHFGPQKRLILCLAGWTDYPFPESIWAAHQAGVELLPPVLERRRADGTWETIVADAGFPAGLPRMMTLDVTAKLGGAPCVLRLRTNMDVYWDQVFVAPVLETIPQSGSHPSQVIAVTRLEPGTATLAARGCVQEYSPDGRKPTLYDYERLDPVPVNHLAGRLTRLGDVTELLHADDDRFIVFGPGDEVTVVFDARRLPGLPPGWTRSFVLRTRGYSKDAAPFTATGDSVEPLPFRGMSRYPYGAGERHPHSDYQRQFNTRSVGGTSAR